jgi:hypothetical protein
MGSTGFLSDEDLRARIAALSKIVNYDKRYGGLGI